MMTWTVRFKGRNGKPTWAVVSADDVCVAKRLVEDELKKLKLNQYISSTELVPMVTNSRKCRILMDDEEPLEEAEHKNDPKNWEKTCFGDSVPQFKSESVTISRDLLKELMSLNRQVGFLLGVLEDLGNSRDAASDVDMAMQTFKEMVGGR